MIDLNTSYAQIYTMRHLSRGTVIEAKNPLNTPLRVGFHTTLGPLVDGVRSGNLHLTIGQEKRSIKIEVIADATTVIIDAVLSDGRANVKITSLTGIARAFMDAVQRRLEEEWPRIFRTLRVSNTGLTGVSQIVIYPEEWGQDHDFQAWVSVVSTPMGGQPRGH